MILGSGALGLLATATLGAGIHRHIRGGDGIFSELSGLNMILIPEEPLQEDLTESIERPRPPFSCICFARFSLDAVVLSSKIYGIDRLMPFSTVDLALGWGPMSNPVNVAQVEVWQQGRFYYWRLPNDTSMSMQDVAWHSANMHMIPANPLIDKDLRSTRRHDVVTLSGYLCDVRGQGGSWRSSRTRHDTGAGACEIIWVEAFRIWSEQDMLNRLS